MDVETWLYNRLGRPKLTVSGEVLTDILRDDPQISWITEVSSMEALQQEAPRVPHLGSLVVRGGCDVRAVEHYVEGLFDRCHEEMNDVVNGVGLRTDHSVFLQYALDGITPEMARAVEPLHYLPRHFETAISRLPADRKNVLLLSFWSDGRMQLYKHRATGIEVPFWLPKLPDLPTKVKLDDPAIVLSEAARASLQHLQSSFDHVGPISLDRYRVILDQLAAATSGNTTVVFLLSPVFWFKEGTDESYKLQREPVLNALSKDFLGRHPNTLVIDPHDFARSRQAYSTFFHFSREVYMSIGRSCEAGSKSLRCLLRLALTLRGRLG